MENCMLQYLKRDKYATSMSKLIKKQYKKKLNAKLLAHILRKMWPKKKYVKLKTTYRN